MFVAVRLSCFEIHQEPSVFVQKILAFGGDSQQVGAVISDYQLGADDQVEVPVRGTGVKIRLAGQFCLCAWLQREHLK